MPDRGSPDTDLDGWFECFVDEVGVRSRAPGSEQVVRSTRRRRLTTAGVTLVVIALLAGIFGGAAGLPGRESAAPISPPSTDALPDPRRLDTTVLDQATQGWVSDWEAGTPSVATSLPCAASADPSRPRPLDRSTREFRVGSRVGATLTVERYSDADQAHDSPAWLVDPKCEGAAWSLGDEMWNGGDSVGIRVSARRQSFHHVVVIQENRVASLTVAGAGMLPESVRQRVVQAMLAELVS